MNEKLEIGDAVVLRGGGPVMTVSAVKKEPGERHERHLTAVTAVWFGVDRAIRLGTFDSRMLTPQEAMTESDASTAPCVVFIGNEETLRGFAYHLPGCRLIAHGSSLTGERIDMVLNSVDPVDGRDDWFEAVIRPRLVPGARVLAVAGQWVAA